MTETTIGAYCGRCGSIHPSEFGCPDWALKLRYEVQDASPDSEWQTLAHILRIIQDPSIQSAEFRLGRIQEVVSTRMGEIKVSAK